MADGGSVDSIPTGPITQDTMKTLGNGVGSWRDIPDAAMQAVIGAVQHGAGAGGDIEKMFYPREPNVFPSSADMGKILPGAASSDTAPWRNIGGSMPVGPGTLMKGASVLPFLGARGMKVAPATIEDFRQAMLGFERRGAPKVANNASGESAASLEAINRNTQENAQKIQRFMVNKNSGEVRPINMVDRADRVPAPDEVHVVMQPGNKPYVWSQGGNVKNDETQGVINRMLYNMGHKD